MRVGNIKIDMETKINKISNSGYNPKIQSSTNSFSTKLFYDNSVVKNTTSEILKNRTIAVSDSIPI
jgi:hypothetical protein